MELIYLLWLALSFLLGCLAGALILFAVARKFEYEDLLSEFRKVNSKLTLALKELDLIETKLRSAESIVLITPAPVLDGTADN